MIRMNISHMAASLLVLIAVTGLQAQKGWAGKYEGNLNGEKLTLVLEKSAGETVNGTMRDAVNLYEIEATTSGNTLKGTATEKTLGLQFVMDARLTQNTVAAVFSMDVFGTVEKMEIDFTRAPQVTGSAVTGSSKRTNPVSSRQHDARLTGTWVKESNYSSGFGDNYGSMSSREAMVFNADGTLTSGGSSTVVGGSNYTGSSSGQGGDNLADTYWYTADGRLYLYFAQNSQTAELGKYYIEDGKMLITTSSGEKLLLYRQ